jgi:uncharacterized membrane protein
MGIHRCVEVTGLSEEASYLRIVTDVVDVRGLLLGGVVIGVLGALDDMTVTQASAVWELRRAKPALTRRDLYRSALRIGLVAAVPATTWLAAWVVDAPASS